MFSIAVFTLLGELIGVTFEQISFLTRSEVSLSTSIAVHILKLPAFFSTGLPLALLMAALVTSSDLSRKREVTALQAIGVCLFRIMLPLLVLGLISSGLAFIFHEVVVPPANYRVAMLLEKEWGVDRTQLAKYNQTEIVYLQYDENHTAPELSFVFLASRFDGLKMKKVTFLRYEKYSDKNSRLREIITSNAAQWNEQEAAWDFLSGQKFLLDESGAYEKISLFKAISVKLTRNILDYVDNTRDNREMSIAGLYQRLRLVKSTKNIQKIRQLQMSIQERYTFPFLGFVFTYLGICIGFTTRHSGRSNSFGIALLIIVVFYIVQALSNYLGTAGIFPVILSAWIPNVFGLILSFFVTRYDLCYGFVRNRLTRRWFIPRDG